MHQTPLIATIVAGIVLACMLGIIAQRLRISPLVGYLVAGVLVGPFTPGFVADQHLASELAEIGIILLMFGVGLHFSVRDLMSVKAVVIPGALLQIGLSCLLGFGLARFQGWGTPAGIVFGLGVSVASTVVTLRGLQERRLVDSRQSHVAVGWLVVQDIAMVLVLVLLPTLAGVFAVAGSDAATSVDGELVARVGWTLAKVAAFFAIMLLVGRRLIPWLLHYVAYMGSRELFRLTVLAIALGVAYGAAQLFDVSLALGAFFAGMILSESELSQQAAEESLPLRDAFAVLFFVSVGMLFDPVSIWREPLPVLALLAVILIGNTGIALFLQLAFRQPLGQSLAVSASLGQIGEFSFILANLGVALGLLPPPARELILAGAIISILLNPALLRLTERLSPWLEHRIRPTPLPLAPTPPQAPTGELRAFAATTLKNHTILVGYGRVGRLVGGALSKAHRPFMVVEEGEDLIEELRRQGIEALQGNAADPEILKASNVTHADGLVVAIPNGFEAGQIVEQARTANPTIAIIARAHSDAEVEHLSRYGADITIMGEREIARRMIERLLDHDEQGAPPAG